MEILTPHLKDVKIPRSTDKVYKDECLFSFDNPETDTGLYVSLSSFFGFGRDHVELYHKKTGHAVFLHVHRERHEVSTPPQGDGPEKKITRLGIGVEGGFDPDSGRKKYDFVDKYSVVVLPQFVTFPWPDVNLPEVVKASVQGVIQVDSASRLAELEAAAAGSWDGEARIVSKHAADLEQLDNGKRIPPSGWQCEKCDLKENLWLNLTDGSVFCGRRFHDGSGGNNHAAEHYDVCKYPLAVKLGTITKEGKADVFSYAEDDMVEDPKLREHLAHFGINIANMEKTDKSMAELELDLNQRAGEWAALQEAGGRLTPVYGAGHTGMVNLGNSCYLNSVIQMLFSIPDFAKRYFDAAPAIFDAHRFPTDPSQDLEIQMAKLAVGLLSGKYSVPPRDPDPDAEPCGISAGMFKALVGRGHPDFASKKQQDAQEFLAHVLTLLERSSFSRKLPHPGRCFEFELEERVQCLASDRVKYSRRPDWLLPLSIPLEAADRDGTRPRVGFPALLEAFSAPDVVEQFFSTALGAKTTAKKTTRLATFPDYLLVQLKKFTLREDWVPVKLDVSVDMPDCIDLSSLRGGGGLQPGEEPLPELQGVPPPPPPMDEAVLLQLADMGFPPEACKRAVFFTCNTGLEPATAWIMEHIGDSDFSDPFVPPGTEPDFRPDADALQFIISMGFARHHAVRALKATGNNPERAADWIFSHQDELDAPDDPCPESKDQTKPKFKDGDSKYRLVAFVSHMGTSSMVGHYVCHVFREGRWIIYNDSKVAVSENPPKDLGYLYLYRRL